MVVLAPTALAAVNANGQTIHSFFKINPNHLFVPEDSWLMVRNNGENPTIYERFQYNKSKIDLIRELELIVIDEISMVRCELLDVVDKLLRVYRGNNEVFGAVQMVFIGDLFQLPPVIKKADWEILKEFYDSPYFFSSISIKKANPYYIELEKIYRQKELEFIGMLNKIRIGDIHQSDIKYLNSRVNNNLTNTEGFIILGTTNAFVDSENQKRLNQLNEELFEYEAIVEGDFKGEPAPALLQLKRGAQIVFVKNDVEKKYYNGQIGVVEELHDDDIVVSVKHESCENITISKVTWENIEYNIEEEEYPDGTKERIVVSNVVGTYTQFPIKLGWAITVHKSQGQTFDKVIADVSGAFADGQVYVALSRCTTLNGLILKRPISITDIKTSLAVIKFAKEITPQIKIQEAIDMGKADRFYKEARVALKCGRAEDCLNALFNAMKYRNDTDTDLFKRYFMVWFNKLYYRATKQESAMNQYRVKIEELESTIMKEKEKNKKLHQKIKNAQNMKGKKRP